MAKDLTIILEDRPGTLAEVAEVLGKAGINIEGACGFPSEGKGVLHVLVEDAAGARRALAQTKAKVQGERDVLVMDIQDRAGELGKLTRRIAQAGVNVNLVYLAFRTRVVIGADDINKARTAAGGR